MKSHLSLRICSLLLAGWPALAQQPVITSFQGNGQLTWTNPPGTNGFTVQWAPTLAGPWSSNWLALDSLVVTGSQTTAAVPMFYRVAQGFSLASMRGTWIMSGGAHGNQFFIAQDDGYLSESAMFIPRAPAGYFTVDASGRCTNTFVLNHNLPFTLSGTFASANSITLDPPFTSSALSRLDDASRCAGNWAGTLSQTNGPGMPASYPVTFSVDTRGLVSSLTGFTGTAIGRMFALTNGTAVGFFFTGDQSNGVYWEIKVSGTLMGNTFAGSYFTDSGNGADAVLGTASLTRQ